MGIWGSKLYQNDTALDITDQFEADISKGKTAVEITQQLINEFSCLMDDPIEELLFWLALADTQWKWGTLLPEVKERALACMDDFQRKNSMTAAQERELERLRSKLLSPQPPFKKPVKKRIYACKWQKGDVFAFRIESDLAKEKGLFGRYFLIQKVSERTWYPAHIVPIVYVKITKDERLPSNLEEFHQLEYVQTWFTRFEDRFWPINMADPQKDIAEKSKIHYAVDAYGFLPQYRVTLLSTSARVIPKKLIYLGNFQDAAPPKGEFVPHIVDNIPTVSWGKSGETFETTLINRYCGHNLRQLKIYHP